ncbi:Hypothetical predicted protein [Xyrichtys novacula]|uniref:Uncharacterized protein n=1 Tax=Xyrichtys novacula TaxID=13765 RepID=A0AAV1FQ11_XYRNO|nr:Hypothetical predicted protein [Xyrichtys novacula]
MRKKEGMKGEDEEQRRRRRRRRTAASWTPDGVLLSSKERACVCLVVYLWYLCAPRCSPDVSSVQRTSVSPPPPPPPLRSECVLLSGMRRSRFPHVMEEKIGN